MKPQYAAVFALALLVQAPAFPAQSGWTTFDNRIITISHPPASLAQDKQENSFRYIKVESNSDPRHRHRMRGGEFQLEIFLVPQEFWGAARGWPDCASADGAKSVSVDHDLAWLSVHDVPGDDTIKSLCLQDSERFHTMYLINITVPYGHGEEATKILDSFARWRTAS